MELELYTLNCVVAKLGKKCVCIMLYTYLISRLTHSYIPNCSLRHCEPRNSANY